MFEHQVVLRAAIQQRLTDTATSAIDKAPTLSTVTNGFEGESRPRGARSDIGADEFSTNAPARINRLKLSGAD